MEKKDFAIAVFDLKHKAFITIFSIDLDNKVYPSKKAQITYLKADKALAKVPSKYADFTDIFSQKLAVKLFKHMGINNQAIKLVDN